MVEGIAIFAALRWECTPVLRALHSVRRQHLGPLTAWRGVLGAHEVWVVKTGIGVARATAAARMVVSETRCRFFVSTGCAGALAPQLRPGDLVIATAVVESAGGQRLAIDRGLHEAASGIAQRAALRTTSGAVLCSPTMLATAAAKHAAAAEFGTVAVEMEGTGMATCAAHEGIPFLSVRTILDTADTDLRHSGIFIDPHTGAVKPLALAAYLATHPAAVGDLLGMQRMMQAAQRSLEQFFKAWLPTLDSQPSNGSARSEADAISPAHRH